MAGLSTFDVSPSTLLTAPESTRGSPPTLSIATDSTLVLGAQVFAESLTTSGLTSTTTQSSPTACVTVKPGRHGYVPAASCNANWDYDVTVELAILFTVLFGISFSIHLVQAAYFKKFNLAWPLLVGLAWELASFALRTTGALDQQNRSHATAALVLSIIAPVWINVFHYVLLGRMVTVFVPDAKVFRVQGSRVALAFVCLSVEVLLLEGSAAILLSPGNSADRRRIGAKVMMAGVACQQAYMVASAVFAARFHYRAVQLKKEKYPLPMFRPWSTTLATLYLSLALMTARNVFRLVQFAGGLDVGDSSVVSQEWCFYVRIGGLIDPANSRRKEFLPLFRPSRF